MPKLRKLLGLFAVSIAASFVTTPASALDTVNVRFSWKLKGEYGFFYLGKERGLYQKKGIDVVLGEGAGAQAALGGLVKGNEDVVIVPAIFAISAIEKGMPVKLAAIYQERAPFVLISWPDKAVTTPAQMEGKSLAVSVGDPATTYLDVFCSINKINCDKINKVQVDPQLKFPQFMQKRVDLISVYTNVDLPIVEERAGTKFPTLELPKFGLNVPGLAVVVSNKGIAEKSEALKRFLSASEEAIELTKSDPAAATAALKKAWSASPSDELIKAQVVATSETLTSEKGRPLGWISDKTISDALKLMSTTEQIDANKPTTDFYTNDLLKK
ncbi:ABC transporter substrate-binding protein [Bradyrhizobium sp. CCBAU 53421]|uniref:ABC transporter substrate-binding protein n=1 Tax=Bradyrhizobium sp. CCBAU 53421 TaxID=1325120 RepID=UPI00188BC908|nr:ABC transporter substrate-binding protein [Bradyrhizobium sp. CCBAU 53421]QOZ31658.1 ABC transporter substrate-binding protein [Bradyrhizobium sp. CCBAU 53421]